MWYSPFLFLFSPALYSPSLDFFKVLLYETFNFQAGSSYLGIEAHSAARVWPADNVLFGVAVRPSVLHAFSTVSSSSGVFYSASESTFIVHPHQREQRKVWQQPLHRIEHLQRPRFINALANDNNSVPKPTSPSKIPKWRVAWFQDRRDCVEARVSSYPTLRF